MPRYVRAEDGGGRQSRSADTRRWFDGGWETNEDGDIDVDDALRRPATMPRSRSGKKPTARLKQATLTPAADIDIDGWGDFNADRLLHMAAAVDEGENNRSQAAEQRQEPSPLRRDIERIDALAQSTAKQLPSSSKEPARQIQRQRTLAVMELSAPDGVVLELSGTSPYHHPSKKPQLTALHRQSSNGAASGSGSESESESEKMMRLPRIKNGAAVSLRAQGLFGLHIADSLETRAMVFDRFSTVWSLIPPRGAASAPSNSPLGAAAECKPPFECSMMLMKICKAIGISLTASPAADVWRASTTVRRRRDAEVDLASFCEFVVHNAIQPALHHFRLDHDLAEYLHTVDTVVQGLVIRTIDNGGGGGGSSQWRLRELGEQLSVLPFWKKGILAVQKQNPLVKMSPSAATLPSYHIIQSAVEISETVACATDRDLLCPPTGGSAADVKVSVGLLAPTLARSLSHPRTLPQSKARAQHDANLRRKLQLRQSWQPRVAVGADPTHQLSSHPAITSPPTQVADPHASSFLGSCIRVEPVAVALPSACCDLNANQAPEDNQNVECEVANVSAESIDKFSCSPQRLLCGACPGEQEAALWCSKCFAVYCCACWTSTHHSTVDLSLVAKQLELPALSARPMRIHGGDHLAPPVAMLYLPTKPLANGKLRRGPAVHNIENQDPDEEGANSDLEADERSRDGESERSLTRAMSSHAILPSLRLPIPGNPVLSKTRSRHRSTPALRLDGGGGGASSSSMDSTTNQLGAVMLGAVSSASVPEATSSASPWGSTSTVYGGMFYPETVPRCVATKELVGRKKLRPAAVTLDATAIFS